MEKKERDDQISFESNSNIWLGWNDIEEEREGGELELEIKVCMLSKYEKIQN